MNCEVGIACFVDGQCLSSIYLPVKLCKQFPHGYMTAKLMALEKMKSKIGKLDAWHFLRN